MTPWKVVSSTVAALVLGAAGAAAWSQYLRDAEYQLVSTVSGARHGSALARWWRCRNIDRPALVERDQRWTVRYAWLHGMGDGDVSMQLNSDGTVVVRSKRVGRDEWQSKSALLSREEVDRIATAIDETGLLCQSTQARDGYYVLDLGKYTFEVESGHFVRQLTIGSCDTIADARAFNQVMREVAKHSAKLGEEINWGPHATYSGPGSCAEHDR